jgi:LysM repeat protein
MSTPDNANDKNFVIHDSDTNEDVIDHYEDETHETTRELFRKPFSMPLIISAVGFLVLTILLIAVIFRGQDLVDKKQIFAIEKRLDLMAGKIDQLESGVNSKTDQIIKKLENLKQTTVQKTAPTAKMSQSEKKEIKAAKPSIHTVQAGDTLYQISRNYGLSIEQLRSYNQLELNAKIYPGQKLKLTP